jgi:RNA polymerase sigma-70 factor (sigma-E family)
MPAVESVEACRPRPGMRVAGAAGRKRSAFPAVSGPLRHCYMASAEPDPAQAKRGSGPAEQGPVRAEQGPVPAEPDSASAGQGPVPAGQDPAPAEGSGPAGPDRDRTRFRYVADPPLADTVLGSAQSPGPTEADRVLTAMYDAEYRSLVRMSAVMLGDVGSAEEVVQESFIAVHAAWRGLRDMDKAVHYLRRSVLNRSRSVLRHRAVVDRHTPKHEPEMPSAEQAAFIRLERSAVVSALRSLPERQREALVLKFYLDLSEEQVAAAMNISTGAVKSHTSRGKAALRSVLEAQR